MTEWIALPNKSGMFVIRKDQVLGFHDIMPGTIDEEDPVTPRVRIHLKDSMSRVVPMSGLDFARLMGVAPPAEELAYDLKPCVLVSTTIAEEDLPDAETTVGVVPLERTPKPSRRTMGSLYNALGTIPDLSPDRKAFVREQVRGLTQGPGGEGDRELDFFKLQRTLQGSGFAPGEIGGIIGVTQGWYRRS